ncbi:MAG: polysaccharide lyase 6 family protein [Bacteroidota bacterium]|nr:polysaccharide lyase 6 family protein [Bacteroidota bacterium]
MKKIVFLIFYPFFFAITAQSKTIYVKNEAELKQANTSAILGDIIILRNGVWQNIKIQLSCTGTTTQPIIFKAEQRGQVIIKGKSSLRLSGSYLVVDGLFFTEGAATDGSIWEFTDKKSVANNCRITNCLIDGFNNAKRLDENYWVALYGKNNRIDHCNFLNKTNLGVLMAVILEDDRSRLNNHSIDSNYFGIRKPLGSNAGEIIRVGVSQHCTFYSNTVIKNNLFEYCDGETEIISIKSGGNIVKNNVFKESQGAVVLRHGNNNTVEGNIFWGNGKEGSGGVRVINEGNWIVNNFFYNCYGEGLRAPLAIMNGVFNSPLNRYLPVRDAVIANNTFYNCTAFSLGEGADNERSVTPINVYLVNNIFYNTRDTTLYYAFSKKDSIYFSGNRISKQYKTTDLKGFVKGNISLQKWDATAFPVYASTTTITILPDSIKQQETKRLLNPLSNNIGSTNLNYFKALFNNSKKTGIQWKPLPGKAKPVAAIIVQCKDAASVYNYLATDKSNYTIELTGLEYVFDKTIIINKNTSILGQNPTITFKSINKIAALFEITGNNQLKISNLKVDAHSLQVTNFIAADSSGNCIHFALHINNCSFIQLNASVFFNAFKNSYADEISVTYTSFISGNGNLFSLKDETDNKGYYNVEKMITDNCLFENNNGSVLSLYRGGTDESTMGPKLYFTNNKIANCNYNTELIKLFGVQLSLLQNNLISNSNTNKAVVLYEDNVRANHKQKNNKLTKSGRILGTKFVNT